MISAKQLMCSMLAVAAMGLLAQAARAGEAISLATASDLIEHASYRDAASATPALTQIVQVLAAQRQHAGTAAKYADYYIGYANYALAETYFGQDDRKADECLDKAAGALQQAIAADADFAEARALLASTYGLEIALHPIRGMRLGGRIADQMNRASYLAPDNPRVTLIRAISDYHTPPMFGGSKARAMKEFGKAIEQFAVYEPANTLAPTWGRAEAHALRGDGEAGAGDATAARRDYRAALKRAPDYAAVKTALAKLRVPASAAAGAATNAPDN